jgi:hypothetical protein
VAAAISERASAGLLKPGADGLAVLVGSPAEVLAELVDRGLRMMTFEGAAPTPTW